MLALVGACAATSAEAPGPQSATSAASREPVARDDFDYDAYLEILREAAQLPDPPPTTLVRVIAPEDQPEVWQSCMQEAGYEVTVTSDGGLVPPANLPADQQDVYEVADYTCHAQYPVDQSLFRTFGEDQLAATYAYYVGVLVPCLRERGVDVTEPPTWESFRTSWLSDGQGGFYASDESWVPYDAVDPAVMSAEEWESLTTSCPQAVPFEKLYPGE